MNSNTDLLNHDETIDLLSQRLKDVDNRIKECEADLVALRDTRSRLAKSLALLSGDVDIGIGRGAKAELGRLSEYGRRIVDLIKADAEKIWKVQELQSVLRSDGADVSEKYASNTLRRLYERGLLMRVGRGQYKVGGRLLALEGFTPEDYE